MSADGNFKTMFPLLDYRSVFISCGPQAYEKRSSVSRSRFPFPVREYLQPAAITLTSAGVRRSVATSTKPENSARLATGKGRDVELRAGARLE